MSAVEIAIEKVKGLDEAQARELIRWLQAQSRQVVHPRPAAGARAMLGFARKFGRPARTTADWMNEIRDGERN